MKRFVFSCICVALIGVPLAGRAVASQAAAISTPDDQGMNTRIEKRYHDDVVLKHHDVKVTVSGGVATLTGTVATQSQKDRAERMARMKGITRVDNQIVVNGPTAKTGTKGTIDRAADKTKEGTEKAIDKTKEGTKTAIEKTKEGTGNVLSKTGEGAKKAGNAVTDAFVLAAIKAHFIGDDVLKGSDISVDVDHHVATLRGTAPTAAARAHAVDLAEKTDGVDSVINQITIGPKK